MSMTPHPRTPKMTAQSIEGIEIRGPRAEWLHCREGYAEDQGGNEEDKGSGHGKEGGSSKIVSFGFCVSCPKFAAPSQASDDDDAMSVTAGVSDTVITIRDKLRGKIGQTKVKRYWPGKAPEWADDVEEDEDIRASKLAALEKAFPTRDDADVPQKDDRRLRRLAESRTENKEEVRADHRRIRQAEIVLTTEEENNRLEGLELEEEDEDAIEERRRRIREKLLQREQEEAALLPVEEEEEAEEEEEESEYETDSEEEQMGIAMVKPVFIPKSQRDTIAERERLEEEERRLEELVKKRLDERKVETRQIVVEEIRKDEEIQKNLEAEANITDRYRPSLNDVARIVSSAPEKTHSSPAPAEIIPLRYKSTLLVSRWEEYFFRSREGFFLLRLW
ncbi:hypothetical protein MUK42_23135 [Musa troglodytarum]|uniref:Micro-fibrillar-associated protein 1 C-terminal domain-containing protein n=1 Tax=Musa troglodytarum TaxID=320322 RepID=A0A9E7I4F2_9LILI|nr:hypothetical protein MUK42_23135 [Musa troglodytarum]